MLRECKWECDCVSQKPGHVEKKVQIKLEETFLVAFRDVVVAVVSSLNAGSN